MKILLGSWDTIILIRGNLKITKQINRVLMWSPTKSALRQLIDENSDFGQENLAPFIVKANNKRYYILRSFMKHIPLATAGGVSFSSIDWYMINHWNAQRVKSKIGYVTRFKYQLHYHDTAKNFTLYINPVTKIRRNPLVH